MNIGGSVSWWVVFLTWPVITLATGLAWWRARRQYWISIPLAATLPLMGFQAILAYNRSVVGSLPAFDPANLAVILVLQGLVTTAAVGALRPLRKSGLVSWAGFETSFARLTRWTLMTMFAALVSGALIPASGSASACATWPLCGGQIASMDSGSWIQLGHRLVVSLVAVQVAWLLVKAWTTQRARVVNLVLATAIAVLYLAQGLIGGLQVLRDDVLYLHSLHSATSAAIWVALVFLVVYTGLTYKEPGRVTRQAVAPSPGWVGTMRDYLALTKPIVVLLLLLTTYGGMVVGGRAWPDAGLTLITLVGGALAAGGSSAINQYIDRRRDRLMVRTAKRPIAAGRLTPAEGLAFGVALCLLAFYLLAGLVNLLAAMLAVAGILYYVVLYSLLLKNATVQNIVIGGGAGAIPPLVGWAAVTGNLTLAGMMLFVIIFFWTPPHFWALALVRRNDYARAGVPMLPVVRGELETRWQIFLYTLALVAITLLLPFFGLGQGAIYIVSAGLLGLWLISSAFRVWRGSGNKIAWKMYRHSSMYLAFLFVALMIDAVI